MHLCEAARRGGLVALAALLGACGSYPDGTQNGGETVQELKDQLKALEGRVEPEANLARARLYARLRKVGGLEEASALARGDGFDLKVLGGPSQAGQKAEAARRVAGHFLERADRPVLCRSVFTGLIADSLRRFVMVTVAATFAEYSSRERHADALEKMAAVADELADLDALKPEARERWHKRARACTLRASDLRAKAGAWAPSPETLKFCEYDVPRHLEEATRAMDFGTREKAARGEPDTILGWYLVALAHLAVARECLDEPTPAELQALAAQEVAARHVLLEVARDP